MDNEERTECPHCGCEETVWFVPGSEDGRYAQHYACDYCDSTWVDRPDPNKGVQLTKKTIRDCYYIMRAMHDGVCPKCGHVAPFSVSFDTGQALRCPICCFCITAEELAGIRKLNEYAVHRRLHSFQCLRGKLRTVAVKDDFDHMIKEEK